MTKIVLYSLSILLLLACKDESEKKVRALPFAGNYDVIVSETNGIQSIDTIYPKIPQFKYLNEDSTWIESKDMKGKVWVANFFFTSCPSICPPMMSQMKRLNTITKDISDEVQFMSFSIDPHHDQPSVLKAYKKSMGIKSDNWQLFTGDEAKTHYLGVKHFMVHADKDPMAAGGFAHSDGMVLVDKEGYVRGIYRGTYTADVDQLNKDLRKLLRVEYNVNCKQQ
jgi:protein SCO1